VIFILFHTSYDSMNIDFIFIRACIRTIGVVCIEQAVVSSPYHPSLFSCVTDSQGTFPLDARHPSDSLLDAMASHMTLSL
jgi:hypothetical protein